MPRGPSTTWRQQMNLSLDNSPPSARGARLLVAEDNIINQQVARVVLERAGFEVVTVADGALAVKQVSAESFDAILMDVEMPGMNGLDATRAIRSDVGNETLPIIAMTANNGDESRFSCLDAGMNDHVAKPIDADALVATLARWVGPDATRRSASGDESRGTVAAPLAAQGTDRVPANVLDLSLALRRIGGDSSLLRTILIGFKDGQADATARLRQARERGDEPQAERIAHTLKGLAGNLGAASLESAAAEVEYILGGLEGALTALDARLDEAVAAVKVALDDTPQDAPDAATRQPEPEPFVAEHSGATLDDSVEELLGLLEAGDSEATRVCQKLQREAAGSPFNEPLRAVGASIEQWDFEAAQKRLESLRQTLPQHG